MTGRGVHIVTVNDYLARRDPQWMGPVFHFLGVSLGMITHDASYIFDPGHPTNDERLVNLRPVERREAYAADVTYGTNNEFGFDYLRDNMVTELAQRVQRERSFAIVDEVDNILIDEARTPLIISGQAEESADLYFTFARLVPRLKERPEGAEEGGDYFIDLKDRAVSPTEEGVDKMEGFLSIDNLYDADPRLARHFEQALRAHALYKRDRDYIVKDGEIVIVDEFTGRQMPGRRWSEGLHQAIEAKEGLRVQRESVTMATITFQNYFRLYDKLSGMTGTAMTEAEEFHKIYQLEVVAIPTNQEMIRDDFADLVFRDENAKFNALIDEIVEMQEAGRPVLVGTVSVEKSEILSTMLKRRGIKHETLNAKFHEKESGIVAQAGRTGAVTIATNMAGRGTDIKLGGDAAGLASDALHQQGLNPAEVDEATMDEALAAARRHHRRGPRAGRRVRRAAHHRHRAPRLAAHRQPAPRPRRPPGRPGLVALLPVARRRPDEALRLRPGDRADGAARARGRRGHRVAPRVEDDRERAVAGRGLQLRHPQARRRVRRRHQQAARDDLRRARQGPPQRGPDRDRPGLPRRGDRHARRQPPRRRRDRPVGLRRAGQRASGRWASPGEGLGADELWDVGGREAVAEHIREIADARLDAREQEVGEADWGQVERIVLLRTIDSLWVEHLTEIDDMRRGIGLRGYAQQDPLNEFRREAYRLYEELRGLIRHGVASSIFRVTVQRQPPPDAGLSQALAAGAQAIRTGGGNGGRHDRATGACRGGRGDGRCRRVGHRARRAAGRARRRATSRSRSATRRWRRRGGNGATAGAGGGARSRLHPDGPAHRAQRSVLVRLRAEVQEVPREVTARR